MTPYLGQIMTVSFNFAPKGWAQCIGSLLSIQQNTALFSILGTFYGGDGIRTFGLPDLRGRVPIHWGQGLGQPDYTLGEIAGTENVTLLSNNLPPHSHPMLALNNADPNSATPNGNYLAKGAIVSGANSLLYTTNTVNTTMAATAVAPAGSNLPVSIVQPYLTVNYITALIGIFPSRN